MVKYNSLLLRGLVKNFITNYYLIAPHGAFFRVTFKKIFIFFKKTVDINIDVIYNTGQL